MLDFSKVFKSSYKLYLDSISYQSIPASPEVVRINVKLKDEVLFSLQDDSALKMTVRRSLIFDPDVVYNLSVAYAVVFDFKDGLDFDKTSVNWEEILQDVPEYQGIIDALMCRISLLIAQISSSGGQNPLVTQPCLNTDKT